MGSNDFISLLLDLRQRFSLLVNELSKFKHKPVLRLMITLDLFLCCIGIIDHTLKLNSLLLRDISVSLLGVECLDQVCDVF